MQKNHNLDSKPGLETRLQTWFGRSNMKDKIRRVLQDAVENKVFPGCVVGVVWKNGKRIVVPFGNFTYDKNSPQIQKDSIFDVASITKSIPTSSLALRLIDQRKLSLDDKVIDFIPKLQCNFKDEIKIRHLLTQTLDFQTKDNLPLSSYKEKSSDQLLNIVLMSNLKSKPGTTVRYFNTTSILLGIVIERVARSKLDVLADREFFIPLRMSRTTFHPEKFNTSGIVPTEIDDKWRKRILQGEVHDESAFALRPRVVGSAGLFSTVPDLLNFIESIHLRGVESNHLGGDSSFGWEINQPRYMGTYASKKTIGKTGFTGCVVICDLEKGIGIGMLSNHTFPKRQNNPSIINGVRRDIANIVFS